jgi:hypothetical protein
MGGIKQRYVIKFLCAKKFVLDRIVAKLASAYGEQAYAKKAVEYWIQQVKLGRLDMEDKVKHGRPPLGDVDVRILACLGHGSVSSVHSIT